MASDQDILSQPNASAVGFAALLPGERSGQQVAAQVGSLAAGLWLLLALIRPDGRARARRSRVRT